MDLINLNNIARSFYDTVQSLNKMVTETVGIDVQWCRAVPHEKSEDVIFGEYTLLDVACPVKFKAVAANPDYNPGNMNVDLFGVAYEAPFEIQIEKTIWEAAMGTDVMPQKSDIVFVEYFNCLYEVSTSTIIYGFAERETGFKVELVKYNPRANRRESEDLRSTIDDLTVSQAELFNDPITEEIDNLIDDQETSQLLNTDADKDDYKTVDMDSVNMEEVVFGRSIVSHGYYDMSTMTQSVIYKNGDIINANDEKPNRLFTCIFKMSKSVTPVSNITLAKEDSKFVIKSYDKINNIIDGMPLEFNRGSFIHLHALANVETDIAGKKKYMVTFNNTEFRNANKKLTNFWASGMKVKTVNVHPLLLGRADTKCNFNISLLGNRSILIKYGNKQKQISLASEIPADEWVGIAINIGKDSELYIFNIDSNHNIQVNNHIDFGDIMNDFKVGTFYITSSDIKLTHIRFYKTKDKVPYKSMITDLTTMFTNNDHDAVINDNAAIPNVSPYMTQQK